MCGSRRDKAVMWQQPTLEWMESLKLIKIACFEKIKVKNLKIETKNITDSLNMNIGIKNYLKFLVNIEV